MVNISRVQKWGCLISRRTYVFDPRGQIHHHMNGAWRMWPRRCSRHKTSSYHHTVLSKEQEWLIASYGSLFSALVCCFELGRMIGSQIDLEIQTVMFQMATTAGRWKQGHNQVLYQMKGPKTCSKGVKMWWKTRNDHFGVGARIENHNRCGC